MFQVHFVFYLLSANLSVAVEGLSEQGQRGVEHTASESEHQVEGRLLLDVVVLKGAAVLELLAGKDQALLVGGDALLVLDLLLDVLDGVGGLNLQSNSLASKGLNKDLHLYIYVFYFLVLFLSSSNYQY